MYCSCAWLFVGCDVWTVDVAHMPGCLLVVMCGLLMLYMCLVGGDVCTVFHVPGCLLVVMCAVDVVDVPGCLLVVMYVLLFMCLVVCWW